MPVHIPTMRSWCSGALGLTLAVILLGWTNAPHSPDVQRTQVTGQVTCAGVPFAGMIHFQPKDERCPDAVGLVNPDGSFRLSSRLYLYNDAVVPGRYRCQKKAQ
jgi:hypothetical protein